MRLNIGGPFLSGLFTTHPAGPAKERWHRKKIGFWIVLPGSRKVAGRLGRKGIRGFDCLPPRSFHVWCFKLMDLAGADYCPGFLTRLMMEDNIDTLAYELSGIKTLAQASGHLYFADMIDVLIGGLYDTEGMAVMYTALMEIGAQRAERLQQDTANLRQLIKQVKYN